MTEIDISKLTDEQRVGLLLKLAGLSYNPPATAFLVEFTSYLKTPSNSSNEDALRAIKRGYIDRYNGKVIKANLSGNTFDTGLYNRDNGNGAAERITATYMASLV
jgi:hypothetical protein